jgi:hypothetical protein
MLESFTCVSVCIVCGESNIHRGFSVAGEREYEPVDFFHNI